jgi:hypothetical protein
MSWLADLLAWYRAPWTELSDVQRDLARHEIALHELRKHMSAVDDMVARFGAATDEIAADLQALRDEIAGDDAAVAAKFEPLVSRLEALGQDPANPVPEAPADQPPVDEPPAA